MVEIQKRLKKPVGMEMSAMWHHCWQYRTRWQAWDYPQRGHERFIDLHARDVNGGLPLPLHLGWWGFQAFNPPQIEPTYPDVIENLGARLVGWDAGISLTAGIDAGALRNTPLFGRAVGHPSGLRGAAPGTHLQRGGPGQAARAGQPVHDRQECRRQGALPPRPIPVPNRRPRRAVDTLAGTRHQLIRRPAGEAPRGGVDVGCSDHRYQRPASARAC